MDILANVIWGCVIVLVIGSSWLFWTNRDIFSYDNK